MPRQNTAPTFWELTRFYQWITRKMKRLETVFIKLTRMPSDVVLTRIVWIHVSWGWNLFYTSSKPTPTSISKGLANIRQNQLCYKIYRELYSIHLSHCDTQLHPRDIRGFELDLTLSRFWILLLCATAHKFPISLKYRLFKLKSGQLWHTLQQARILAKNHSDNPKARWSQCEK